MRDFFHLLREQECLVEYTVEDFEIAIFDVYFMDEEGKKIEPALELTEAENLEINEHVWEHDHDLELYEREYEE